MLIVLGLPRSQVLQTTSGLVVKTDGRRCVYLEVGMSVQLNAKEPPCALLFLVGNVDSETNPGLSINRPKFISML